MSKSIFDGLFAESLEAFYELFEPFRREKKLIDCKGCDANTHVCKCESDLLRGFEKKDNGIFSFYEYVLNLPTNIDSENISVTITKDNLLKIEVEYEEEKDGFKSFESYTNSVTIPKDADRDSVDAQVDNEKHVLVVTFDIEEEIELDLTSTDKDPIVHIDCKFE